MHVHAKSWVLPAGFRRKRWDVDAMVGDKGYWGSWRDAIGLDGPGETALEQALSLMRQRIDRFGMNTERFGLVHAGLRPAKLLVHDQRVPIISFLACGLSWSMDEVAA